MSTTPSKRVQILSQFGKILTDGEANIGFIEINRPTPPDYDNLGSSAAFIYSGRARRMDDGVIGEETFQWEIFIRLWLKGGDPEEFLKRVQNTLGSDEARNLNCIAEWSWLIDTDELTVDTERELGSYLLTYEVRYSHAFGEA